MELHCLAFAERANIFVWYREPSHGGCLRLFLFFGEPTLKLYETLILLRTSTTESNLVSLEESFTQIVEDAKGTVKEHDRWGRIRLAYPVEHSDYGFYILSRFSLPEETVTESMKKIQSMMKIKFNSSVIRYASILLSPEEFEETPKRPGTVEFVNFDDKKSSSFRPSTSGVMEENITSVGPSASSITDISPSETIFSEQTTTVASSTPVATDAEEKAATEVTEDSGATEKETEA